MLVLHRIVAFLREFRKGAFCIECLTDSLTIKSRELVAKAIQRLTRTGGFTRTQSHYSVRY